jgi:hypothetical protein
MFVVVLINQLSSAKVLSKISDSDASVCKTNNDLKLAVLIVIVICIPLLLTTLNEVLGDLSP